MLCYMIIFQPAPEGLLQKQQRRSVPNVLEDVEAMQNRLEDAATSAGTLKAADSSSTTIHKEEDQLQLKWETVMGSKFTIVVRRLLFLQYYIIQGVKEAEIEGACY